MTAKHPFGEKKRRNWNARCKSALMDILNFNKTNSKHETGVK